jgi:malate dehydrogenase (oxaloacetate-decarboxylating)(NADP+)
MRDPVYFGNMMVKAGDADGFLAGLTMHYPETIRPALQFHHTYPGLNRVVGVYLLLFEDRMVFVADTTVNLNPTAEDLAEIATEVFTSALKCNEWTLVPTRYRRLCLPEAMGPSRICEGLVAGDDRRASR